MKNILKSVLTIAALAVTVTGATGAFFNSAVAVENNVIETGTLLLAVDTAQEDTMVGTWGTPNAFNVVRQMVDGSVDQQGNFISWENAAPGLKNTYTVGVRNNGTIPFKFRAAVTGEWLSTPGYNADCVADHGPTPDTSLVSVSNVHQYASDNCEGDIGCENLYYGLTGHPAGWTHVAGLTGNDGSPAGDGFYYGVDEGTGKKAGTTPTLIGEKEFAIYQVELTLSNTADSCYQGATYHFDLGVEATQEAATF